MLHINEAFKGKTLEAELKEYLEQGQGMDDVKRMHEPIYTKRADGVIPEYNIRTNRWDIAQNAMDKVNESKKARAEARSNKKNAQEAPKTEGVAGGGKNGASPDTAASQATSPE